MAQVTTGLIRSIRSIRSIRGKRIIVYPLAYCPPGRVSYRAYPGTPPPSVYQVTRGTAFQAAERYVRRLSCGDGYPYHQKPQALQAAERYVQQLSYLYDSWLKWGRKEVRGEKWMGSDVLPHREPIGGLEPPTHALRMRCSTN